MPRIVRTARNIPTRHSHTSPYQWHKLVDGKIYALVAGEDFDAEHNPKAVVESGRRWLERNKFVGKVYFRPIGEDDKPTVYFRVLGKDPVTESYRRTRNQVCSHVRRFLKDHYGDQDGALYAKFVAFIDDLYAEINNLTEGDEDDAGTEP